MTDPPGGEAAELLARRLSDGVRAGHPSNGSGGDGGDRRKLALEIAAAMLAETSAGTAEHSDDVVLITEAIGERMGLNAADSAELLAAAGLHDIGKTWVPDRLLEKPGPLTEIEWEVMRQHTVVGERILSAVEQLRGVARLVRHSHERWDGRGYPDGLAGAQIPLGSRIIFCADTFHAIRSDRPYRKGRSTGEALAEIKRCAGTQFDPDVVTELERVIRERNRRPRGGAGSSRLFALLMCLVVGGAGSAIARSGALGDAGPAPPPASAPKPPPACGPAACPTVAAPVGGLGPVGALTGSPGARVLFPGLPGQLHRENAPGQLKARGEPGEGKRSNHGKAKGHAKGKARGKANGHAKGEASRHSSDHSSSSASVAGQPASSRRPSGSSGGSGSGSHRSSNHSRGSRHSGRSGGSHGGSRGSHAGGVANGGGSGSSKGNPGGASGSRGH